MGAWENNGMSDEYYSPKYIFDALGCEFDMDVAAPVDTSLIFVPAKKFIHANSLDMQWEGFVWMNPPFGKRNSKGEWLDKLKQHGNGIALVPDRTSVGWWQKAALECDLHLAVNGKIAFHRPDGSTADQPSTGTTLFAYGKRGVEALLNAERNGLGTCFKRPLIPHLL